MPIVMTKETKNMAEQIADQDYFFDAEGHVTTDEAKGERWLARKGANVLEEHREALASFSPNKVTPSTDGEADAESAAKGEKPSKNKAERPASDKGAK